MAESEGLQYSEFTRSSIAGNAAILMKQFDYGLRLNQSTFFVFNPQMGIWAAYSEGSLVGIGKASGGRPFCQDIGQDCKTPTGLFSISRKGSRECYSTTYPLGKGGAPMPYCMFFKRGYAIHASKTVPPHNASYGCIRVTLNAAKWLHQGFIKKKMAVIVLPY